MEADVKIIFENINNNLTEIKGDIKDINKRMQEGEIAFVTQAQNIEEKVTKEECYKRHSGEKKIKINLMTTLIGIIFTGLFTIITVIINKVM